MRNTHYILSIGLTLTIAALSLYPVQTPELLNPVIGLDKLVHVGMYALLALSVYWESRRGWLALVHICVRHLCVNESPLLDIAIAEHDSPERLKVKSIEIRNV